MSVIPNVPRLSRAAIISFDIFNPIPQVITFQYNPDTMSRSLQGQTSAGGDASVTEAFRLNGPPVETINLEVELDATDRMAQQGGSNSSGVFPQLAALEMLLYPKSSLVVTNTALAALGIMEIVPPEGPFTLFSWGSKRILPIRLTKFDIIEEAHDTSLNPMRAKVSLGMRVLSYADLSITHPGYTIFLAHQIVKETMATIATLSPG